MNWEQLISSKRFGLEQYHDRNRDDRSVFQRDFDRLIFSAPFRRLQNKTQVFPLPGSVFVHNRLTHSLEVSCVGRSLGNEVIKSLMEKHPELKGCLLSEAGDIVSAACLAHDLGNTPFGHSGEKAICSYFAEGNGLKLKEHLSDSEWNDLIHFEGNANSFRLLTHQFNGRREGGFVMTYSTLASIVKYPFSSLCAGKGGKFGFFQSERNDYAKIADELGIKCLINEGDSVKYARYPLVYLVEAADDICYLIMDMEDAHKLKLLTTQEIKELLFLFIEEEKREHVESICNLVKDVNEQVAYLRSTVIGLLVKDCVKVFVSHEQELLEGTFEGTLIKHVSEQRKKAYEQCAKLSVRRIYQSRDVVDVELAGFQVISTLIDLMIEAVTHPENAYSKLLINRISEQYDIEAPSLYGRVQAVLDYISGMTDVFALDLYRKINGNGLPAI